MTTKESNKIKKELHGDYNVYFKSKTGELRVRVYTYYKDYDKEYEKKRICELLNRVSASGHRPKFEIDHKTYQGFIYQTFVVFQ